jgi:hypothetical protein
MSEACAGAEKCSNCGGSTEREFGKNQQIGDAFL